MVQGVGCQLRVSITRQTGRIVVGMKKPNPAKKKTEKKITPATRLPRFDSESAVVALPGIVAGPVPIRARLFGVSYFGVSYLDISPARPREKFAGLYKV